MDRDSISQQVNSPSHLYGNSKYGHFSQITAHNKEHFPLFSKATPTKFVLQRGDSLYIPPNWWHWVKSYGDRSISVNFWFKTETWKNSGPICHQKNINWPALEKWSNEYLISKANETSPDGIWIWIDNSYYRQISMTDFVSIYGNPNDPRSKTFAYLVTIKDYEDANFPADAVAKNKIPSNENFLKSLEIDIEVPFPADMIDSKYNFWMNFGREAGIDSGLHYDEEPGLLCVVDGYKEVTLYPPSDSEYLYPYPLKPYELMPNSNSFYYNLYREGPELDIDVKCTSSKLLEVTLIKAPNVAKIAREIQIKYGPGRTIYGIKNCNGILRWEFYFYGMDKNLTSPQIRSNFYTHPNYNPDMNLDNYMPFHKSIFKNDSYDANLIDRKGLIVYSVDLTEETAIKETTPCLNLYYVITEEVQVPFILHERTFYNDNTSHIKSVQYIDTFSNILSNTDSLRKFSASIGLGEMDVDNLYNFLNNSPYKCTCVALVNKGSEMGIYMFGIVYQAFVSFLVTYNYPASIIAEVMKHEEDVSKLQLEVGFHFVRGERCHIPSRTAFYGIF